MQLNHTLDVRDILSIFVTVQLDATQSDGQRDTMDANQYMKNLKFFKICMKYDSTIDIMEK